MKIKIQLISVLTAASIFIFSSLAWADGPKYRHRQNADKKAHKVVHHHRHWKKTDNHRKHRHHYRHRAPHRYRHRDHGFYHRSYRHWRCGKDHFYNHKHYRRHRHGDHRPIKKYRHHDHHPHRPIYRHTGGKVSVLASKSHHGWSIKISTKDKRHVW